MTETERSLIAGCGNGDKAAWDAFVLQYSGLVYHTIKRTLTLHHTEPRPDLVEDLYQEFFVSILRDDFKKLRQFRGDNGCTLASWLRVVTTRLTIDFLRKQWSPSVEVTDAVAGDDPDPDAPLINAEQGRLLNEALSRRSSLSRSAVLAKAALICRRKSCRPPQNLGRRRLHPEEPDIGEAQRYAKKDWGAILSQEV